MSTNEKKIYIYHHTDDDGYGGSAALYDWIMFHSTLCDINKGFEYNNNLIVSHAVNYDGPLPETDLINAGDIVYYVDYSFSNPVTKQQFKDLHIRGVEQYWLDHHATSKDFIEELKQLNQTELTNNKFPEENIYFDDRISGAMIAAIYPSHTDCMTNTQLECAKVQVPQVIQFISDWDLFEHALSETKPFHYGFSMVSERLDIRNQLWHDVFNHVYIGEKTLIKNGNIIIEYEKAQNAIGLNNAFIVNINGREVVVLNRSGNSTIFGDAYDVFGVCMSYAFKGTNWVYSIFSNQKNPDANDYFDCEAFAKQYGGGGHKTAAGFNVPSQLDFEIVGRLVEHPRWKEYNEKKKKE